jgi:hypothetical protein
LVQDKSQEKCGDNGSRRPPLLQGGPARILSVDRFREAIAQPLGIIVKLGVIE